MLSEDISEMVPATDVSILERLSNEDTALKVHHFIHTMREPYKEVFSLRVFGELSFEKIANIFGKTTSWARVTYYRAKQQIQRYMEEIEHEED